MRRLLIGAAVVAGLAVTALALVVANLNQIVAANRERIIAGISEGFGRPVQVGRITVGFRGGVAVELDDLRVGDDPAFSTDAFLVATQVHAVVRFWPLLRRRVEVRRIVVKEPAVTVIRTAQGTNLDSLGRRTGHGGAAAPGGGGSERGVPAVAVALLNLEGGTVRIVDSTGPQPIERTIAPLDVHLSDVSATTPVTIDVSATLAGEQPTVVHVQGTVGPVGDPPFAADVPIVQRVTVRGPVITVVKLAVDGTMRRDPQGRPVASLTVTAPSATVGNVEASAIDVAVTEQSRVATLERLSLQVFGGTVVGKGRVDHTGEPTFAFETTVRGLDVAQALASRDPGTAARLSGRLDADGSVAGTAGDAATVRRSLTGRGHAEVHDGTLRGVNIADGVLSATGIAGLVTLVPPRLRDGYPDIFGTDDTRFDTMTADVRIGAERLQIESAVLGAKHYTVRGHGSVTFTQYVDFGGTFIASPGLTRDVIGFVKEAQLLSDDGGLIAIPFQLTGRLPHVRAKPDAGFVTRALKKALTGEALERLVESGKPQDGKAKKGSAGDLLRKGLGQLFGR